jgi:hypothetical protein
VASRSVGGRDRSLHDNERSSPLAMGRNGTAMSAAIPRSARRQHRDWP